MLMSNPVHPYVKRLRVHACLVRKMVVPFCGCDRQEKVCLVSGVIQFMSHPRRGSWSVQGCLLRRVGEEEAAEQEKEMLAFRGVLLGERRGSRSVGVSSAKER